MDEKIQQLNKIFWMWLKWRKEARTCEVLSHPGSRVCSAIRAGLGAREGRGERGKGNKMIRLCKEK